MLILITRCISAEALSDFAFRRVLLHGHFAQPLMLVGPRVYDGVGGYHLVQPFVRTAPIDSTGAPVIKKKKEKAFSFWSKDEEKDDVVSNDQAMVGGEGDGKMTTVLVNRGFVTTAQAQAYRENPQLVPLFSPSSPSPTSLSASPSAETKNLFIQALLRPPSEIKAGARPAFTPDNNIGNNEWFYIDLEAMKGWVDRVADGKIGTVQSVLMDEIYGWSDSIA
jgi:surfeit locus 1 family protein